MCARGPRALSTFYCCAEFRAQFGGELAKSSGLRDHLLSTGEKQIFCVDTNPWLGIQAAGGISTGQNHLGKALMELRAELRATRAEHAGALERLEGYLAEIATDLAVARGGEQDEASMASVPPARSPGVQWRAHDSTTRVEAM